MVLGKSCRMYKEESQNHWLGFKLMDMLCQSWCILHFQMTLMMMICKNSPKYQFRGLLPSVSTQAARWTNTLLWWVIHGAVLKDSRGVSVVVFDCWLLFFFFYSLGIENSSSWFQFKLFQCWVEESSFHILRATWCTIRDCPAKGNFIHPNMFNVHV